jgi:hypothetical protein
VNMRIECVFARIVRQAEERRAEHERVLAEERRLIWQRALVLRLLLRRFGAVPEEMAGRVNAADNKALEAWMEKMVIASHIEEVFAESE